MVLTKWGLMPESTSPARSSFTFGSLSDGRSTCFTPARLAARTFSLIPPTGSTRPLKVISPVMAKRGLISREVRAETMAVTMVTPAEGPSFGMAPAGTCTWT